MANKQNYLQKKELNRQKRLAERLISERYPKVSSIIIHMQYNHKVHMIRTVNFFPSSHAYFFMDCLIKDCSNGGFEFAPMIAGMIKKRKKSGNGKCACKGKNSSNVKCDVSIAYEISIKYSRRSK
jgi:hypothetical protein